MGTRKIKISSSFRKNSSLAVWLSIIGDLGGGRKIVKLPFPEPTFAKRVFLKTLSVLAKRKMIVVNKKTKYYLVKLTDLGKIEYLKIKMPIVSPLSENLFCLVIFDIPEEFFLVRNLLRKFLKAHGFTLIQKSF